MMPSTRRSQIICRETASRAGSVAGVMSPNPTVDTIVIVKYSAPDLVSGWEKVPRSLFDIAQYVHANSTMNSGMTQAIAMAARATGCGCPRTARSSNPTTPRNTTAQTTEPTAIDLGAGTT